MSTNFVYELNPIDDTQGFSGRANISAAQGVLSARFNGGEDSYVLRFELPEEKLASGVLARLYLEGWENIQYAAIGYTKTARFHHIKASNIRCDAWVDLGFTHQDIIWKLQNGTKSVENINLKDVRLFIKGTPSKQGSVVKISSLAVLGSNKPNPLPRQPLDTVLSETLYSYLKKGFRDYESNARAYMETGKCPMPGGRFLEWTPSALRPEGLETVNTFRFSWHGLHPVISLLLYAEKTGEIGPIFAARSLIDNWLELSYYTQDDDIKFAWYDHGTAERLLAFILMWAKAIELGQDERFINRLEDAILSHARLLNSEAFYAYHQPNRYHNHAWFQDAALIAAALAFTNYSESQQWLENAISRFEDQLSKLIVRDGGFAIFIENSIGYHHGVQRLAEFVGDLVELSGQPTEIPTIARELVAWSDFLRYPDGRVPAQGDTFRLPPRTGLDIRRGKPWQNPSCTVLPKAGYAVVRGNHEEKPWMLCLFNTSLSETHKHEDNLSVSFWFDGIEWLIDPSFYSHEYKERIPGQLRSASYHTAMYLEKKRYLILPGKAGLELLKEEGGFAFNGWHCAYEGIQVFRKVKGFLDELELSFCDSFVSYNVKKNVMLLNYILGEGVSIAEVGKSSVVLLHSDSNYSIEIIFNRDVELSVENKNVGLGFMQAAETLSLSASLSGYAELGWKLKTKSEG